MRIHEIVKVIDENTVVFPLQYLTADFFTCRVSQDFEHGLGLENLSFDVLEAKANGELWIYYDTGSICEGRRLLFEEIFDYWVAKVKKERYPTCRFYAKR